MRKDIPQDNDAATIRQDAKGQFGKNQGDRKASGVDSAKPTVITGSEDATAHKEPPGQHIGKEWSPHYDEGLKRHKPE
ncbi:hypothetical protein [Rhizobium sp. SGZ-381]|uniref:hypothetical protein n=1 Tax=Rhizobium sp. SGZ-381 TaxID=3342800 RepID=UPI00366BC633